METFLIWVEGNRVYVDTSNSSFGVKQIKSNITGLSQSLLMNLLHFDHKLIILLYIFPNQVNTFDFRKIFCFFTLF